MEPTTIVALVGSGVLFLGAVLTFLAANGKTRVDYRTAMESRVDAKIERYMKGLEEQNDELRAEVAANKATQVAQGETIAEIQAAQEATRRRESILYRYMALLREHIDRKLPPPPPTIPMEISDWFESFEDTWPGVGA